MKARAKQDVKATKKVCFGFFSLPLDAQMPSTYGFFNKFGGLLDAEVTKGLNIILERKLESKAGDKVIKDLKELR